MLVTLLMISRHVTTTIQSKLRMRLLRIYGTYCALHQYCSANSLRSDLWSYSRKAQFRSGRRRVQHPNANHPSYQYPKAIHHPIKLNDATAQDIRNMLCVASVFLSMCSANPLNSDLWSYSQQARLRGMMNRHNANQRRDLEDDQELSRRDFDCSSKVSVKDVTGPELWYILCVASIFSCMCSAKPLNSYLWSYSHQCAIRRKANQRRGLEGDLDAEEPFGREYDDSLVERDAYDDLD